MFLMNRSFGAKIVLTLIVTGALSSLLVGSNAQQESSNGVKRLDFANLPLGLVVTVGNKPVVINGAITPPGATILPGAVVQSYRDSATIFLRSMGQIDIAPQTLLLVNFDESNIEVRLRKGCATVKVKPGIIGSVSTPQGVFRSTSDERPLVDACLADERDNAAVVDIGAARVGSSAAAAPNRNWPIAAGLLPLGPAASARIILRHRPEAISQSAP